MENTRNYDIQAVSCLVARVGWGATGRAAEQLSRGWWVPLVGTGQNNLINVKPTEERGKFVNWQLVEISVVDPVS